MVLSKVFFLVFGILMKFTSVMFLSFKMSTVSLLSELVRLLDSLILDSLEFMDLFLCFMEVLGFFESLCSWTLFKLFFFFWVMMIRWFFLVNFVMLYIIFLFFLNLFWMELLGNVEIWEILSVDVILEVFFLNDEFLMLLLLYVTSVVLDVNFIFVFLFENLKEFWWGLESLLISVLGIC